MADTPPQTREHAPIRDLYLWALALGLVPALFFLFTHRFDLPGALAELLHGALRNLGALTVFALLRRRESNRPRGHLGATLIGAVFSGLILFLLAQLFPGWLAAWLPLSRLVFEGAEAAIVGWCLLAAATAWGLAWITPPAGALLGAVVSAVSLAWMPLEGGLAMGFMWGVRTLVLYAPLALLLHLWSRRRPLNPELESPAADHSAAAG